MSVISITVSQSAEQIVSGIPKTVAITTNIPATIFYTLDGSTPNIFSAIYTGTLFLPFNLLVVNLNIIATNGTDFSPVITETYITDIVDSNTRLPHANTTGQAGGLGPDLYPFGTPPFQPNQQYTSNANSGVTVYNPNLPAFSDGYDASGNPTLFSNQPYNSFNYQIQYETKNVEGETGIGIGTLPGQVTYPFMSSTQPDPGQNSGQGEEYTNQFTTSFDPRAMVIFQDLDKEDPNDPPTINRNYFSWENPERARDGTLFLNAGGDFNSVTGSFLKSYYNPRNNTMTSYYRDSVSNKWIITTSTFNPTSNYDGNLAASAVGRNRFVFEWIPFKRQVLM